MEPAPGTLALPSLLPSGWVESPALDGGLTTILGITLPNGFPLPPPIPPGWVVPTPGAMPSPPPIPPDWVESPAWDEGIRAFPGFG